MSKIIMDNQTDLSTKEAICKLITCLVGINDGYEVTQDDNTFILKESNQ